MRSRRGVGGVRVGAPVLVVMTEAERDIAVAALARLLADLATIPAQPPPHSDAGDPGGDDDPGGEDDPGGDWHSCDGSS